MDAYVIGSGPNGLTAAITLARAGLRVSVLEAQSTPGGGTRSAELTLPGFLHDVCSAAHPMGISSPAFRSMPLAEHGLEWIQPGIPLAHPLDGGKAAIAWRSVERTAEALGEDSEDYRKFVAPLAERWTDLAPELLAPLHIPRHPLLVARFGVFAPWPATFIAKRVFRETATRALFAGMAAHSVLPLEMVPSAAFAWIFLLTAHAAGWPIPRGGAQKIADALISYLRSLGGSVETGKKVESLRELPRDTPILCDVTPRQLVRMSGGLLPESYCAKLRTYRYGPGVFKVDWALKEPIPWTNPHCHAAGTLHLGGTIDEIAESEDAPWRGRICERPFVLLTQPTIFDPSRAPVGMHIAWAYCHVPNGSSEDRTAAIEAQVERFAPGFQRTIIGRHTIAAAQMETYNANLVGGDVAGGAATLGQLFLRPVAATYRTPDPNIYLCSASTPPGGGVHGMCGFHAARTALRDHGLIDPKRD